MKSRQNLQPAIRESKPALPRQACVLPSPGGEIVEVVGP